MISITSVGRPKSARSHLITTFMSLRSNVVIRWEYMLGSTLFVVWQRGQSDSTEDGSFNLGRSLGNLFGAEQNNTFVVKLNYWFSL